MPIAPMILVVDNDQGLRESLRLVLEEQVDVVDASLTRLAVPPHDLAQRDL